MGLFKINRFFVFFLLLSIPVYGTFSLEERGKVLYLLHKGNSQGAFSYYVSTYETHKKHDFELLADLGKMILEQGSQDVDVEVKLLSLFGASIAMHQDLLPLFEKGIRSQELELQLAAISGLVHLQDDKADRLLLESLSSPFLLVRLEAALALADKNNPYIFEHLQSLIDKVPSPIRALFPQILIKLNTREAAHMLRQLLNDKDNDVRVETLRHIGLEGRDDFLSEIQNRLSSLNYSEQEASLFALSAFEDTPSLPFINKLALTSLEPEVRLAALSARCLLGEEEAFDLIIEESKKGNLFAFALLGTLGNKATQIVKEKLISFLEGYISHINPSIRFNASFSLIQLNLKSALPFIKEFLLSDPAQIALVAIHSPGRTMTAYRICTPNDLLTQRYPDWKLRTIKAKETLLQEVLELSENEFLGFIEPLFVSKRTFLIPALVEALCQKGGPEVIAFLKKMEQKAGAPLIRNYCTLALYRLDEKGNYEDKILKMIDKEKTTKLIQFREEKKDTFLGEPLSFYALTPEESSRFLITAFELFIQKQSLRGIGALIQAMQEGPAKNKYALAGLLMKGVE